MVGNLNRIKGTNGTPSEAYNNSVPDQHYIHRWSRQLIGAKSALRQSVCSKLSPQIGEVYSLSPHYTQVTIDVKIWSRCRVVQAATLLKWHRWLAQSGWNSCRRLRRYCSHKSFLYSLRCCLTLEVGCWGAGKCYVDGTNIKSKRLKGTSNSRLQYNMSYPIVLFTSNSFTHPPN